MTKGDVRKALQSAIKAINKAKQQIAFNANMFAEYHMEECRRDYEHYREYDQAADLVYLLMGNVDRIAEMLPEKADNESE